MASSRVVRVQGSERVDDRLVALGCNEGGDEGLVSTEATDARQQFDVRPLVPGRGKQDQKHAHCFDLRRAEPDGFFRERDPDDRFRETRHGGVRNGQTRSEYRGLLAFSLEEPGVDEVGLPDAGGCGPVGYFTEHAVGIARRESTDHEVRTQVIADTHGIVGKGRECAASDRDCRRGRREGQERTARILQLLAPEAERYVSASIPPFSPRFAETMGTFLVEGGHRLEGRIRPAGNKNAALPCLAATVLASEPVVLENVPRIRDVETFLEIVDSLGASVSWSGANEVTVDASGIRTDTVDGDLASRIRASVLLAGPLLARFGHVELPPPGGDVIGRRRMDTHFLAFEALGATLALNGGFTIRADRLVGANIFLDEPSVTGTENALMAAVRAEGSTTIRNAAAEPHVQDLCALLNAMGARISGVGTHMLRIEGVKELSGARFRIGADHIETGSFIGLAAVTRSDLTIEDAPLEHLDSTLLGFRRLGIRCDVRGADLFVHGAEEHHVRRDAFGAVPKVDDGPWPAFPADLTSIALVAATQCHGTVLIHEKMFESRMYFTDKLVGLGASIILCDPHRAVVVGPSPLQGGVVESPDIRAGMALLIAALGAEGTSEIHNIRQIERGYERIDERLIALGAKITRG